MRAWKIEVRLSCQKQIPVLIHCQPSVTFDVLCRSQVVSTSQLHIKDKYIENTSYASMFTIKEAANCFFASKKYNASWYQSTKINYTMKATRPFPGGSAAVPRVLRYCCCQSSHATSHLHKSPARGLSHHHDCHRAPLISEVTSHEQETPTAITASPTAKAADDTHADQISSYLRYYYSVSDIGPAPPTSKTGHN